MPIPRNASESRLWRVTATWTKYGKRMKKDIVLAAGSKARAEEMTRNRLSMNTDEGSGVSVRIQDLGSMRPEHVYFSSDAVSASLLDAYDESPMDDAMIAFAVAWGSEIGWRATNQSPSKKDVVLLKRLSGETNMRSILSDWTRRWFEEGMPDRDEFVQARLSEYSGTRVTGVKDMIPVSDSEYEAILKNAEARAAEIVAEAQSKAAAMQADVTRQLERLADIARSMGAAAGGHVPATVPAGQDDARDGTPMQERGQGAQGPAPEPTPHERPDKDASADTEPAPTQGPAEEDVPEDGALILEREPTDDAPTDETSKNEVPGPSDAIDDYVPIDMRNAGTDALERPEDHDFAQDGTEGPTPDPDDDPQEEPGAYDGMPEEEMPEEDMPDEEMPFPEEEYDPATEPDESEIDGMLRRDEDDDDVPERPVFRPEPADMGQPPLNDSVMLEAISEYRPRRLMQIVDGLIQTFTASDGTECEVPAYEAFRMLTQGIVYASEKEESYVIAQFIAACDPKGPVSALEYAYRVGPSDDFDAAYDVV